MPNYQDLFFKPYCNGPENMDYGHETGANALNTTTEIIDELGGNAAVADLVNSTPKIVSGWRAYGRFPSNTYIILKRALTSVGQSAPDYLWSMRGAEPPPRRKRSA